MLVKLISELKGVHVHTRVFMGPDSDHLALSGTLAMRVDEYLIFGYSLLPNVGGLSKVDKVGWNRIIRQVCGNCGALKEEIVNHSHTDLPIGTQLFCSRSHGPLYCERREVDPPSK